MKLKHLYLILIVLGAVLPYSQLIPYLMESGSDVLELVGEPFSSRGAAVFGFDLTVSAVAFLVWLLNEISRKTIRYGWAPLAALFLVGLSMALPLLLYLKEIGNGSVTRS